MLQKEEAAIASVQKALKVLDSYLLEHTFLVGEKVTLADIIAACNLYLGFTKVCLKLRLCVMLKGLEHIVCRHGKLANAS